MLQPDELTLPEIDGIVEASQTLDGTLTKTQILSVVCSLFARGFAVVRKDWVESVCNEHDQTDVGPVLSDRPN